MQSGWPTGRAEEIWAAGEPGASSAERRLPSRRSPPPPSWAGPSVTFAVAPQGSGRSPEARQAAVCAARVRGGDAWGTRRLLGGARRGSHCCS